jgi:hypothetical protein
LADFDYSSLHETQIVKDSGLPAISAGIGSTTEPRLEKRKIRSLQVLVMLIWVTNEKILDEHIHV